MLRRFYILAVLMIWLGGCSIPAEPPASIEGAPVEFTQRDRELIHDFYGKRDYFPGLADPSILAPSLSERLEISGRVPPGLAAMPLPVELEERLSTLPPGYRRFRAGEDVVLMDVRTREVLDLVRNVIIESTAPNR